MISAILTVAAIVIAFYVGFKIGIYCGANGKKLKEVVGKENLPSD